ncbi:unnamed protein product [Blepharisma stoltei]|uniref:Uncharacterized protein n=1 Tax=Blepharisma stoltei TaxID=1481888 RepID=A0AAU9IQC5_9CILI|nr:unnamed protein product [Blepharisma stoltei]
MIIKFSFSAVPYPNAKLGLSHIERYIDPWKQESIEFYCLKFPWKQSLQSLLKPQGRTPMRFSGQLVALKIAGLPPSDKRATQNVSISLVEVKMVGSF